LSLSRPLGRPIPMAREENWPPAPDSTSAAHTDRVASDITVAVPVYNTPAEHLDECVRSLFAQTVRPREILVVDDGTTLAETDAYLSALQALRASGSCATTATSDSGRP
jgi:hypothetical protein